LWGSAEPQHGHSRLPPFRRSLRVLRSLTAGSSSWTLQRLFTALLYRAEVTRRRSRQHPTPDIAYLARAVCTSPRGYGGGQ